MSKIRLNGTTSGYTELTPPAVAGDNTITLPSGNGSANQFLKNGSTAGTLGWSSMSESGGNITVNGNVLSTGTITSQKASGSNAISCIVDGTSGSDVSTLLSQAGSCTMQLTTYGNQYAYLTASASNGFNIGNYVNSHTSFLTNNTERARITSGGALLVATTNDNPVGGNVTGISLRTGGEAQFSCSAGAAGYFNRKTNDGKVIEIWQDGSEEGTISVSGSTVSYVGGHLSRWSQIPGIDPHDKTDRPEILRGSVMSNLDEMCDWIDPESGEPQANEQLNKTKISDVEGDKNVAGVFQSWDDDDDTWVNDFYLAMTGDFVIRIAEGVTVERGDLLMSAGDGTAKPQDDDLIRSSTVAKVTSTTVSHVHPDGSYCIPCVLMAC